MVKVYHGIDFSYSGGECDTVIKIAKYTVTIIDGYLIFYDTETGMKDDFYIFANDDIEKLYERYQFVGGIEIFYRSQSGLSGDIKLLIDCNVGYEYGYFKRLYRNCIDNVIFGSWNMLVLVDRDEREFIWLPKFIENETPIIEGHIIADVPDPNDMTPILMKCKVYKTLGITFRFVDNTSLIPYEVLAVEIKSRIFGPSLWKDRWGRYFYAEPDNATEIMKEILSGSQKCGLWASKRRKSNG